MGTESGRMIYGAAYLDSHNPPPLKEKLPADGDGGGSFNHGFLLQMNGYVSGAARGRAMLKEGLELQRKLGHCCRGEQIETFSASHGQLNEAAAAVALYDAVETNDGPMIELLRDWWWSEMVLCNEMAIPGRETQPFDNTNVEKGDRKPDVWGPGWRAMQQGKLVGSNPCRDLCWRLVMGHPIPKAGHRLWKSRYYLAARALKMLPEAELKALRPAPGFKPPLPYTLVIERWEDGSFEATWNAPDNEDTATEGGWSPALGPWLEGNPGLRWPSESVLVYPGLRKIAEGDRPA